MSKYFRVSVLFLASVCVLSVFNAGCEEEKKADEASTSPTPTPAACSGKVIFLATVPDGNFGGAAGADVICANQKPGAFSGSTFKALVTDNSRRACYSAGNDNCYNDGVAGQLDWVLPASSNLCTTDLRLVGTTDARKFIDYVYPGVLSTTATVTYSGFNIAFGQSATNCTQFASTGTTARTASAHVGLAGFISNATTNCTTAGTIYCVQQ